ncbi:MAG: dehydrogenase, partial [Planctomycetaceae bacterium]|nr:dehydrogenase [Planctomycetaceae bacterium]
MSPAESLARFRTPADLRAELVVAEPTIAQPVFINFDERGRLWVAEYRQYPEPAGLKMLSRDQYWRAVYDKIPPAPPHHDRGLDRISIHADSDGDGRYDERKVFLDGLNIATAFAQGRGGVWVLHPPYLLFYPDRDRDDRPDGDPEVHLEGFGLEDTHSVVNSLTWGPDGWLYAAQGSTVTGNVRRPGATGPDGKPEAPIHSLGQLIWRYHPEQKKYEIFAEGGGNAFGVEIDSKGRIFSGHNGGDTRGFHYVQGGYSQKGFTKHGPLSNPYAFGFFPPLKHHSVPRFTHTWLIYEGDLLPEAYRGQLFGPAPILSHVVRSEIQPLGSTWETRDIGYALETTDEWFRPVDIKLGPDGALYVADWYDGNISHLRNSQGVIDRENGRIYRLGPAEERRPREKPRDLGSLPTDELVGLLKHPNRWQRQTALRLLYDRRDASAIPQLTRRLGSPTSQTALEALWGLHACGGLDEALAGETLTHSDPYVRLWTVRLLADDGVVSPPLAARLARLAATEPHVEVRSQLACSARRLPAAECLPIVRSLAAHAEDSSDPHLPLLLWWAIERHCGAEREGVLQLLADEEFWRAPLVAEHLLPRIMKRFALAGTRADLLICARLFRSAPDPASRARLLQGFAEAFQGRSMTNLPDELVAAVPADSPFAAV